MSTLQMVQWALWGTSLLAGVGAILALFKLRYAERFLPAWDELKGIENLLPARRDELRQAAEAIDRLRAEIGQLEATVGALRILKEWQDSNPEAPARIQQMMVDLERLKSELAAVQLKLAGSDSRLLEAQRETEKLTSEKGELAQQNAVLRDQVTGLAQKKDDLERQTRDLDEAKRRIEGDLTRLRAESETCTGELTDLRGQIEKSREELAAIQRERDATRAELAAAVTELGHVKPAVEQLRQEKATLERIVRDLEERQRQLAPKIAELQSNLGNLQQQARQAEQERAAAHKEREQAKAERDSAKAELQGLQKSIESYKAMIDNMNLQLQRTAVGTTDLAKALEDLAQPVLKFRFARNAEPREDEALRMLSGHLDAKGLHYPERVQLAFHTSLKAARINPLVVLAGVSGTGKSALPVAYAEALGMNLLTLAVQPGWSGPQDLLGFYNYLERKYKATDLARALAQMSKYSAEDLPGLKIESRKDQMLLLLLDEMNLARIEYYFSDFLSRLEQRRGRNVDDAQRRREVALLVDAGALPAGEIARSIFPDFNVLFVGTMNEDESTQSLSEKVIDRANVLRFGAPKDLKAKQSEVVAPKSEFITRTTWEGWGRHFDGAEFEVERKALRTINEALEKIHRPFGHRVYRAVLDYMANYPGVANQDHRRKHALADQLEQKIVPKLRGLDTQDSTVARCLDTIRGVVETLGDSELVDSYREACEQPLFEWFGVKRS